MSASDGGDTTGQKGLIGRVICIMSCIPGDIIAILARVILGLVFWLSAQTKIEGFALKASTFFLFESEYKVPLIPPDVAAYMATAAELICPLLLWAGLATRFGAIALLCMTLVIQIFVYPNAYVTHGLWAIGLLYLIKYGPGRLSLDHLIRSRYMGG
ncbi:MAG: DoxX family protein [Methyloligellaceae bacterium]